MNNKPSDVFNEISVIADNAKNIIAIAEQSQEADELSAYMLELIIYIRLLKWLNQQKKPLNNHRN